MESDYAPDGGWFTRLPPVRLSRTEQRRSDLWLSFARVGAVFGVITIISAIVTALSKVMHGILELI